MGPETQERAATPAATRSTLAQLCPLRSYGVELEFVAGVDSPMWQ